MITNNHLLLLTNHPIALAQIITKWMSQIVVWRHLRQHRHKALCSRIDQRSIARYIVNASVVAHITLLLVTPEDGTIQIDEAQTTHDFGQLVKVWAALGVQGQTKGVEPCELRSNRLLQGYTTNAMIVYIRIICVSS